MGNRHGTSFLILVPRRASAYCVSTRRSIVLQRMIKLSRLVHNYADVLGRAVGVGCGCCLGRRPVSEYPPVRAGFSKGP